MKIFYYKLHKDRKVLVIQEPEEKHLLVQINTVLLAFKNLHYLQFQKIKAYVLRGLTFFSAAQRWSSSFRYKLYI